MYQAILLISVALPMGMALLFLILLMRRRQTAPGSEGRRVVRVASLKTADVAGGRWWFSLPFTLLPIAGTAALLAVRWQRIPGRFPIHWGFDGRPNGWVDRSVVSVFGLLLVGVVMVLGFGLFGEMVERSSPGHDGRETVIRTTRKFMLCSAWMVTILFCGVSLLPLMSDPSELAPIVAMVATVLSAGLVGYFVWRWMRMPEAVAAAQDSTDSRFWRAGLFYYNPADSAIWVPKRFGIGYSLNFGRAVSWVILGGILLVPVAIAFLVRGGR